MHLLNLMQIVKFNIVRTRACYFCSYSRMFIFGKARTQNTVIAMRAILFIYLICFQYEPQRRQKLSSRDLRELRKHSFHQTGHG